MVYPLGINLRIIFQTNHLAADRFAKSWKQRR